jgi:hypothetical protein
VINVSGGRQPHLGSVVRETVEYDALGRVVKRTYEYAQPEPLRVTEPWCFSSTTTVNGLA